MTKIVYSKQIEKFCKSELSQLVVYKDITVGQQNVMAAVLPQFGFSGYCTRVRVCPVDQISFVSGTAGGRQRNAWNVKDDSRCTH